MIADLCSAEVKNVQSHTSTPHYAFMEWCLVKHRDNFTFLHLIKVHSFSFSLRYIRNEIHKGIYYLCGLSSVMALQR